MASFPSSIKTFATLVDLADSVLAAHQNERGDEITAIETALKSFTAWTPTWSGLTVGSGTVDARYSYDGGWVDVVLSVAFNSTSITGAVNLTNLPISIHSSHATNSPIGTAVFIDTGTNYFSGLVYKVGSAAVIFRALDVATYVKGTNLSSIVPFTWGNTDVMTAVLRYKAA